MKKYFKIILLLLLTNQGFSQIDEIRVNLLRAKNQTIEINKEHKLSVLIYPELPRTGEYIVLDKKNRIIHTESYQDVDYVIINFKQICPRAPNGKYTLKFKTTYDYENYDNNEEEIIFLKLK